MPDTIADLDTRLLAARDAYYDAIDNGDLPLADIAYGLMDSLLDERCHCKQTPPCA